MNLREISTDINEWFSGCGPLSDIVLSSRIRLARNLAGHKFVSYCSPEEKAAVLQRLRDVIAGLDLGDEVFYVGLDETPGLQRDVLVERHLISRHHALGKGPRGAVIARHESFTAMINEEDHLRLQVLKSGCQLRACADQIDRIDDLIEQQVEYAFHPRFGYLTACPTNLGSGVRVSVMLHLPALKLTGHLEKFLAAAKDMHLAVRGLFGEGTEATSDLYQLSNQVTLGVAESQIIEDLEHKIIPEIAAYETEARKHLLFEQTELLDDKIARALALLQNAHLISSKEALVLLSHLRLGLNMHLHLKASTPAIDKLVELFEVGHADKPPRPMTTINRLFMLTLPAHLQLNCGKVLDAPGRDALRARIIRGALNRLDN